MRRAYHLTSPLKRQCHGLSAPEGAQRALSAVVCECSVTSSPKELPSSRPEGSHSSLTLLILVKHLNPAPRLLIMVAKESGVHNGQPIPPVTGEGLCPSSPHLLLLLNPPQPSPTSQPLLFRKTLFGDSIHHGILDHRDSPLASLKAISLASEKHWPPPPRQARHGPPRSRAPASSSHPGRLTLTPDSLSSRPALPTSKQNLGLGRVVLPVHDFFCPETQTLKTNP